MAKTVVWAETALNDLENVIEYISQDSPAYAASFYDSIKGKARSLSTLSKRGRVVPEFFNNDIREIFVHRYRLIYKITNEQIIILAFIHGARELKN